MKTKLFTLLAATFIIIIGVGACSNDDDVDYKEPLSFLNNTSVEVIEKESLPDWLVEKINKMDFSDPLTILYGHNMINGSMFAGLMKFSDQDYFDAHPYVYVYTKDKVFAYEIFSFYTFDNRHLLYAFDFSTEKGFKKYLEEMEEVHSWDLKRREDVEVTTDDKLLALETCVGNATDNRYLLHAKLVWSGSNEEYLDYIGAEEN